MNELSVCNNLLIRGDRVVIPPTLQRDVLEKLHSGHQGTTKCRERAKHSVWWPGITKDIENIVSNCTMCCKHRQQHAEPLLPSTLPARPWQNIATDLFKWKKHNYLFTVDYYSRYIEIAKLTSTTSDDVITHLKSIFARHGIPETVMSDNGPQYAASIFKQFASEYRFTHDTSSPRYPQANGAAERAVKTVKQLLEKNDDPYIALLAYRSTPIENGYSPAELLIGRKLRTTIPVIPRQLIPTLPKTRMLREKEKKLRHKQKTNFDSRHEARELVPLETGDTVWILANKAEGTGVRKQATRSYTVQTRDGVLRRNRRHLQLLPSLPETGEENSSTATRDPTNTAHEDSEQNPSPDGVEHPDPPTPPTANSDLTQTRSGRVSKPPE